MNCGPFTGDRWKDSLASREQFRHTERPPTGVSDRDARLDVRSFQIREFAARQTPEHHLDDSGGVSVLTRVEVGTEVDQPFTTCSGESRWVWSCQYTWAMSSGSA
jgi:hypothetical protein